MYKTRSQSHQGSPFNYQNSVKSMEVVNKKYAARFGKQKYFNTHENEINL